MAKAPAFQFYVRDWLCSRKVTSMSGECVKAYLYLLCESWLNEPRATLPNDDAELASMARVSTDDWKRIKCDVMKCFKEGVCEEHSGHLYNERLLEVSRNYEKNQRPNNKNALRTRKKREPNAKKRTSSSTSSSSSIASSPSIAEHLKDIWVDYVAMRKSIKKPMTDKAQKLILAKLDKLTSNESEQVAIVEKSIQSNWLSVFPLSDDTKRQQARQYGRQELTDEDTMRTLTMELD